MKPIRQRKGDRLISPGATDLEIRCDYAVAPFDRVAREMDQTWGIDRLPEMVSPATAEKYGRAMAFLNACIDAADPAKTAAAAENCIKGMRAMDAEARASGHRPITPAVWEYELDGRKIGVIRDVADWEAAHAALPGALIHTLREVAIALAAYGRAIPAIDAIKSAIPGTQVLDVRRRMTELEEQLDDFIPF